MRNVPNTPSVEHKINQRCEEQEWNLQVSKQIGTVTVCLLAVGQSVFSCFFSRRRCQKIWTQLWASMPWIFYQWHDWQYNLNKTFAFSVTCFRRLMQFKYIWTEITEMLSIGSELWIIIFWRCCNSSYLISLNKLCIRHLNSKWLQRNVSCEDSKSSKDQFKLSSFLWPKRNTGISLQRHNKVCTAISHPPQTSK